MKFIVEVVEAEVPSGDISGASIVVFVDSSEVGRTKEVSGKRLLKWKESIVFDSENPTSMSMELQPSGLKWEIPIGDVESDEEIDEWLVIEGEESTRLHIILTVNGEDFGEVAEEEEVEDSAMEQKAREKFSELENDDDDLFIQKEDVEEDEFLAIKPWLGAICPPSHFKKSPEADTAPSYSLYPDYVNGYRAHDARHNLHSTGDGRILFTAAAVGICMNVEENQQEFLMGHDDDIVCMAWHEGRRLAATGQMGKKPSIRIWNVDSMDLVSEISGFHRRAVVYLDFSADGDKILSVGLDDQHSIAVYDVDSGSLLCSTSGDRGKVLCARFDPHDDNKIVSMGVKHIKFFSCDWRMKRMRAKKGVFGNPQLMQSVLCAENVDGTWSTGTASGKIYLWKGNQLAKSIKAHKGPLLAMKYCPSSGVVATGGRDGIVRLFDGWKNVGQIDVGSEVRALDFEEDGSILWIGTVDSRILKCSAQDGATPEVVLSGHGGELWGLDMHPVEMEYATACSDGYIRFWSILEKKLLHSVHTGEDMRSCAYSPDGQLLAVGCEKGKVVIVSCDGYTVLKEFKHRRSGIYTLKFSPDGSLLAVGSHDNFIDVYDTHRSFHRKFVLKGHHSYITHLDFSEDGMFLQSNSGDYELLFWSMETGRQHTASHSLADTKWKTWTCSLGWPVQGIWPKYGDGTDVNACCRSHLGTLLASGEDTGLVRLFRWPCIGSGFDRRGRLSKRPESVSLHGHSAHVTNVIWASDDTFLVSTGGGDRTVIQWALE